MGLPGIFQPTVLCGKVILSRSIFIRAMHPKTRISPTRVSIEKILKAGWAGQHKIHGHRAQIHLPSDPAEETIAYNRHGNPHKKLLPEEITQELRRVFKPESGWTVIDTEWLKPENKLFVFDILKLNGKILRDLAYGKRWELLPKLYLSPHLQTLPLLTNIEKCMEIMSGEEPHIEGLVFKSVLSKGFEDSSIIRCRKKGFLPLDP